MERRPLEAKKAKIEVTLATSEASQLGQIESEFQILKSLIPNIANRQQINEVCNSNKSFLQVMTLTLKQIIVHLQMQKIFHLVLLAFQNKP